LVERDKRFKSEKKKISADKKKKELKRTYLLSGKHPWAGRHPIEGPEWAVGGCILVGRRKEH